MNDNFTSKYQHLKPDTNFKMSVAIMDMLQDNIEVNIFTKGDFELAVNLATTAWNLAIINDQVIISLLVKKVAKELAKIAKKTPKQTEVMLMSLIKLKNKLFKNVFRRIGDYESSFKDGKPYLKVASGKDMPSDYFANLYRETLLETQKYGWAPKDE